MWSTRKSRAASCTHETVKTTSSYGLQRTVCEDCGNVSFEGLADLVEELLEDIAGAKGRTDSRPTVESTLLDRATASAENPGAQA